mmetsp:Transcript_21516/g.50999  ORF Transcript_21516/g.50999 Transcript_21516/m.50999 type:complete len:179 (-) Transcript_21516:276-812(-)
MIPATCARYMVLALGVLFLAAPAAGFGISCATLGVARVRNGAQRCPALLQTNMDAEGTESNQLDAEGTESNQLTGERLQKALQYQKVFNEINMGADMRKFNIEKVRKGKQPLLLESRLGKASRYAAIFETAGERGIAKALRVEVNIAKEEVARQEEEASYRKQSPNSKESPKGKKDLE